MFRRFSLYLYRRAFAFFLIAAIGCSAQAPSSDLDRRIEREVRIYYEVPSSVQIAVGPRKPSSEFPNYDAVEITFTQGDRQQKQNFLVAKDGSTLMRLTKLDISKDPYAELMKKIDLSGRPVRGAKDAKVTIVNYDDFQCPYCARMYGTLVDDVMKTYGDRVKWIIKDFPLADIHPWATRAAVDANCLLAQNEDAYWSFADYVHRNQKQITMGDGGEAPSSGAPKSTLEQQQARLDRLAFEEGQKKHLDAAALQACVKAQSEKTIVASREEGMRLGVKATPTLFVNGEKVDGAVPEDELRAVLDRALREAGEPVPPRPSAAKPSGQ